MLALFLLMNCKAKNVLDVPNSYEVESISLVGADGTVLFKIWCYGITFNDAQLKAKKNAVHAILFRGVPGSNFADPMITDPETENKFSAYFSNFFSENGNYLKYVTISNEGSIGAGDRLRVGNLYKVGTIVQVNFTTLRKEMEQQGIIRKFGL